MVGAARLELATSGLKVPCSGQLSYTPKDLLYFVDAMIYYSYDDYLLF